MPLTSLSQKITFSGTVLDKWDKNDTLYYTFNQEGFDSNKFVICQNKKFEISFTKAEIEKMNVQDLVFLNDRNTNPNESHACIHRIYLSRILAMKETFSEDIFIKTDLQVTKPCSASVMHGAKTEGLMKFVGSYQLSGNGEIRSVELKDVFFQATSYLSKQDENLMTMVSGVWNYNEMSSELTISLGLRSNPGLGLLLVQPTQYKFTVTEENGVLKFSSEQFQLIKMS
jgi:hypothetical protein